MDADLLDLLEELKAQGIDPMELVQAGQVPQQQAQVAQAQQRADALRSTPGPQMRSAGRLHFAASPGEFLGAGLSQAAGIVGGLQAQQQGKALLDKQAQARVAYLRAMAGRKVLDPNATANGMPQGYGTNGEIDANFADLMNRPG